MNSEPCLLNPTKAWLEALIRRENFRLSFSALEQSQDWHLLDGAVRHRSGSFFAVIGIHAVSREGVRIFQPLLDQREVGTLALIAREDGARRSILVQAKAEPGNVGLFQLAPSFQATASNAACKHGGSAPLFIELFRDPHTGQLLSDSRQSEQGSRFYGKFNRNCTLLVADCELHSDYHRWMDSRDLCRLLAVDHLLNTDIRSTLVCSDWHFLAGGLPFQGTGFAARLQRSYSAAEIECWQPLAAAQAKLGNPAAWQVPPTITALQQLPGWTLDEEGPCPETGRPFRVRHIRVESASREVSRWDQPIITSAGAGRIFLPMAYRGEVAHFLFRLVAEPGFGLRQEFTPALTIEPGAVAEHNPLTHLIESGDIVASCRQSEEGGRFLLDENEYRIVDIGECIAIPADYHWLSLGQLKVILDEGGTFTNEARSAVSLLLRWI